MSSPASVERRERLRLFVALPLPADALERLVGWQEDAFPAGRGVRPVPRENLHVTLAFLGHRPADELPRIVEAVRAAADGVGRPVLRPARYRETPRVGMLVLDDEEGRASLLAGRLAERLERAGVFEPERRPWLPHLTVLRFRDGPPRFAPQLPELGAVSPSEVALYHSVLRPSGAQYEVRESVALGG